MDNSSAEQRLRHLRGTHVPISRNANSLGSWDDMYIEDAGNGKVRLDVYGTDPQGNLRHSVDELDEETYERVRADLLRKEQATLPAFSSIKSGNTVGRLVGETARSTLPAVHANPPIEAETEDEAITGEQILDGIQIGLDVIGLIPVIGEAADIINAGISFARGDQTGAVLSLVAALPLAGWFATTGKVVRRANKATNSTARASSRSGAKIKEIAKTKKRNQLKKNHKSGKRREKEVEKELADEGHVVIGTQVSAKTPLSRRVIDILIKDGKTGKIRAIEVKAGGAKRSTKQISKDDAMAKHGSELIGKNAPKGDEFKGTIKIPTEVRK